METFGNAESRSVHVSIFNRNTDFRKLHGKIGTTSTKYQRETESAAADVVAGFLDESGLGDEVIGFVEYDGSRYWSHALLPKLSLEKLGLKEPVMTEEDPLIIFGQYELYGPNVLLTDDPDNVLVQIIELNHEDAAGYHRAAWASKAVSKIVEVVYE